MAELGQQMVGFSTLVSRAAEESFLSLKELVEQAKSTEQSDTEKKISILKYLSKTQQRMLRLNVLAKWCQQVPLIQYCQQLASTLSSHDACFMQAADSLFFMHEGLQQARAPIYDVPSAVEVLLTGSYQKLPKCVEDSSMQSSLNEVEQKPALRKLDTLVRAKLLEVTLPKEFSEVKVSNGTVTITVDGEFKVLVTLGYRGHLSMWRILHLKLLVGERNGPVKLEASRQHILGDDLERRMSAAENPFVILYTVLHELCLVLVMDTVTKQVQALRQGRWKDAIRFELISDSSQGQGAGAINHEGEADSVVLRTPGLKLMYWLDTEKGIGFSDSRSCPFIKIEPGPDLRIKCSHSTFVIDPITGKEAEFSLDQSCIDVEKLLLRAISCNRYTRLLEIQKKLVKNAEVYRVNNDVILQSLLDEPGVDHKENVNKEEGRECEGSEVLRVRAFGSSFFTLGISIRSGRFLLQASENVLVPSVLAKFEDALNQGSTTAVEVFISLRTQSILHLFASIGRFLGLEIYEHGFAAVKVPKNLSSASNMLLMGFPDCGSSYFLLLELEKEFKPIFKLLGAQPDLSGPIQSLNDLSNMARMKKIDIGQMQIVEDELNLSILDSGKLLALLPDFRETNRTLDSGTVHVQEISSQMAGSLSSFTSIVDEIFELEKGNSVTTLPVHTQTSAFDASPGSQFGLVPLNSHNVQTSHANSIRKVSSTPVYQNGSLFMSNSIKMPAQSSSFSTLSTLAENDIALKNLSGSKSEQDLASLKSTNSIDVSAIATGCQAIVSGGQPIGGSLKIDGPSSLSSPLVSRPADSASCDDTCDEALLRHDKNPRKRTISDMLSLIPSLQIVEDGSACSAKRRKTSELAQDLCLPESSLLSGAVSKINDYNYWSVVSEANKGNAPASIYISAFYHVIQHCSLCIKHARLTSQMDDLDIPFVEEIGFRSASSNIWFSLPFAHGDSWQKICLRLGRPGSMHWDVKINDQHFRELWELQKGIKNTPWGPGIRIANTSDMDSHIRFDQEGVVLSYQSVKADSIEKLVADIRRLSNARTFALGMRKLLGSRADEKPEEGIANPEVKSPAGGKGSAEGADRLSEQMRRTFKIEAVGLMSLWFSFGGGVVLARFVVEWESGKDGCTMHVSPDQLWPHTKFLEDFINGGEVASLLDCIRLTAGPLHALAAATRPARAGPTSVVPGATSAIAPISKQSGYMQAQGINPTSSITNVSHATSGSSGNVAPSTGAGPLGTHGSHGATMLAAAGRGGPGIVPSSLLPIDVSVVLRGPYWIRIIYRKRFAVDMRCFAGDQVWLQPATPPKGGALVGGSLPCPQFRPFILEHVAQELNGLEPNLTSGQQSFALANAANSGSGPQLSAANGNKVNLPTSSAMTRAANQVTGVNRVGSAISGSSNMGVMASGLAMRRTPGTGVPAHVRGELNTAIIGLGDDGGYGGGWVPLVALKKVLRGILKYLGVLWLFAQLPDLLREILGSILKDNEGSLLNLDQEQPALRFFVGGYVFAVSVHRVQLLLQVLSVKRFHHQQQQQQPNAAPAQEELSTAEISEICDYFSRRVASEPYDASRVASFITLLTLPISVLREFLKLISWKKGLAQAQGGEIAPAQRPRIELCLESHSGSSSDSAKSNIHYDRQHNSVDFALTVVLDPAHIPYINAAGGAAWLPYCVSVRLRFSFGETPSMSFLGMEGSHGGRACWLRTEDWERCKQRVSRTVEVNGSQPGDVAQGRLRVVADGVQRALHMCLQSLRDGGVATNSG